MVPIKSITLHKSKGYVPTHYHRPWDDDAVGMTSVEWTVIGAVFTVIWALYWLILHWVDHWVGDWLAWYVELLSPLMALPWIWLHNRYGSNPLHWWPMLWGHRVRLEEHNAELVLMDSAAVVQVMGGPMRVWCDVQDVGEVYLKFRLRKDAVWFGLFPYFRARGTRKKRQS